MPSVWRQIPGEFLAKVDPDLAQDDWQGLFRMRENQQERHSGYLLRDDSKIVGILGTLFSQRTIDGETQPFCNLHNWFVEETYRGYSLWLMRPVLRLVDHTLTDFTPTEPVARISLKLGFRSLDSRLRILPPFPVPITRSRGGGLEFHEGLERLSETDTPLLRDNDHGQTGHLLVSQGENSCLIFYSRITRHALPYCYINYLSNKALFERAHLDLRSLLLKRTRSRFCALDDRTVHGLRLWPSFRLPIGSTQLYRSSRAEPTEIDTLYSEVVVLGLSTLPDLSDRLDRWLERFRSGSWKESRRGTVGSS